MKPKRIWIAVLILGFLCVGAVIFIHKEPHWSAADVFKTLYTEKAAENPQKDYSFMNIEQLDGMVSSTVGTVVDTDELTVDVMGAIISGNAAEIILRVTANSLDTILYDTGLEHFKNYRFNDDNFRLLDDMDYITASFQHIFSDQDTRLAPNQFVIRYSIVHEGNFAKSVYTVGLKNFGYFDFSQIGQFKSLYTGTWSFDIAFDPDNDTSKTIAVNEDIRIEEYDFMVNEIKLTPLICTVNLICHEDDSNPYIIGPLFEAFVNGSKDCILTLADGTMLNSEYFGINSSGGSGSYNAILSFDVPISVEDIVSITIFGREYALR